MQLVKRLPSLFLGRKREEYHGMWSAIAFTRVVSNHELFRKVMASDAAIELKDLNEMTFLVDLMRLTRIDSATPPTADLVAPPWEPS
jgi:hypothetical protein